jgi:large subunit ribosomal protein L10
MEIWLNVTAVYENGLIFTKDTLAVDEEQYKNNLTTASRWSINLAVEAGIMNSTTTPIMITKAFKDARAIAISQSIMADAVVKDIVIKAERQMLSLKSELNIG